MTREQYIQYLRQVVHQANLDSMTADQLAEMQGTYTKAIDALVAGPLADPAGDTLDLARAKRILESVTTGLDVVALKATDDIAAFTTQTAALSFEETYKMLSWDGRASNVKQVKATLADIRAGVETRTLAGNDLGGWISNIFDDTESVIRQKINAGRVTGMSYPEIADDISKSLYKEAYARDKDGNIYTRNGKPVRLNPEHEMETVLRSYVQASNVHAQSETYTQNRDIVSKVQWVATLENGNMATGRGTCPRCAALDGQVFDMDEAGQPLAGPPCPLHPRCRCILSPKTKTWEELGFDVQEMEDVYRPWVERTEEAIALGGRREIIDYGHTNKDFSQLFKEKSPEFQNNLVGPVRAEMIRQNYFDLADIIDYRGNLHPIRDMRDIYDIPGTGSGPIPGTLPPPVAPVPTTPPPAPAPTPAASAEWYENTGLEGYADDWVQYTGPAAKPDQKRMVEKLVEMDGDIDVRNIKGEGAYHLGGYINMPKHYLKTERGKNTFFHEYGHLIDVKFAEHIDPDVRGAFSARGYKIGVSNSTAYNDALEADLKDMKKWKNQDWKKLGGKGRMSNYKLHSLRFKKREEIHTKILDEIDVDNIQDFGAKIKAQVEYCEKYLEKASPEIKGLYELTKEYKSYLEEAGTKYRSALLDLVVSEELGTRSNLAEDWFRNIVDYDADRDGSLAGWLIDLVGGTTNEYFGFGHSKNYYRESPARRNAQAFANMFLTYEHTITRPFLEYFVPNQLAVYEQLIKELTK